MFTSDNTEPYLFHYTRPDTFLDFILPEMRLRMSPLLAVNDPRESKTWSPGLFIEPGNPYFSSDPNDLSTFDPTVLMTFVAEFEKCMRERTKVICFAQDDPNPGGHPTDQYYARAWARSAMWAHYADCHKGVCIVLDRAAFSDQIAADTNARGTLLHQEVTYQNFSPRLRQAMSISPSLIESLGRDQALRSHRDQHAETLFFNKANEWRSENEYRWVLFSEDDDPWEYVTIQSSLAGVIFGADFPEAGIEPVRSQLSSNAETPLYKVDWENGTPILRPR